MIFFSYWVIYKRISTKEVFISPPFNCQAQSQHQVNLSLKTELALFSLIRTYFHPPTPTRLWKFIFQHFSLNLDQITLEEYSRIQIGRRPQFFSSNGRRPPFFGKWKTTFIIWQNERQPQFLGNWKKTSICWSMEDDLNLLATRRRSPFLANWRRP